MLLTNNVNGDAYPAPESYLFQFHFGSISLPVVAFTARLRRLFPDSLKRTCAVWWFQRTPPASHLKELPQ